jgi:hypothetical protein
LHVLIGSARGQFPRQFHVVEPIALGHQSGDAHPRFIELLGDHLETGARLGFVESHQQITLLHVRPVMDQDLGHDPPRLVLNLLHVRLSNQSPGNHHRSRQRHQGRPPAANTEGDEQHAQAGSELVLK